MNRVRIRVSVRLRSLLRVSVWVWLLFDYSSHTTATFSLWIHVSYKDKLSPRRRRDDMPPAGGSWNRLVADLRPSADGSAVRSSLAAGQLQAASVPIA